MKLVILGTVTAVWAITTLLDASNGKFEMPGIVHVLMSTVIGYFVGSRLKGKKDLNN